MRSLKVRIEAGILNLHDIEIEKDSRFVLNTSRIHEFSQKKRINEREFDLKRD